MPPLNDVNALRLSQYRLQFFNSWRLVVIGDHDLSYHHQVELIFSGVQHINCDVEFYWPEFRDIGPCLCGCNAHRIGIRAERGDFEVIATELEVSIGTVFHYERENLQPGERIAPWVKRDA